MSPTALLAPLTLVAALSGCSSVPYRSADFTDPDAPCGQLQSAALAQAAAASGPPRGYRVVAATSGASSSDCERKPYEKTSAYDLLVTEFDDQGWTPPEANAGALVRDAAAGEPRSDYLASFFRKLTDLLGRYHDRVTVVVFVHGWHNNADFHNRNVSEFRNFLLQMSKVECATEADGRCVDALTGVEGRHVIGVFVGWAGESLDVPGLRYLTVEDRKLTAQKISQGSIRDLLGRLTRLRERRSDSGPSDIRLLMIGHSYGGLILYESLQQSLIKDVLGASAEPARYAGRQGDLVVLVNPAFEAARFESLARAARYEDDGQLRQFVEDQYPSLVSITSKGDIWIGSMWTVVRHVTAIFERSKGHAESPANLTTIGHNDRYITHDVGVCTPEGGECAPADLCAQDKAPAGPGFVFGQTTRICHLVLTARGTPTHNPVWVVSADTSVSSDHDDIFNDRMDKLMVELFNLSSVRRAHGEPAAARQEAPPAR